MAPPRATLGGVPLANAADAGWVQVDGTGAPLKTYSVHRSRWPAMKKLMGKRVTLSVKSDTSPDLTWKGLIPVRETPSPVPHQRMFVVSDVRYLWPREIVARTMNIPRRTGDRFMQEGVPVAVRQTFDRYGYAYASLDSEGGERVKWTPRRAVESVLSELASKCGHGSTVESMPYDEDRTLTVEGVDMADNGDAALSRVLAHLPHAAVTIDPDGNARVFDATNRADHEEQMSRAGRATEAGQIDRLVDLDAVRPSAVHVYFAKEVELRFDSVEESDSAASTSIAPGEVDEDLMLMENVLPLPDPTTSVPSRKGLVTGGTYIPIREALAAWNAELQELGDGAALKAALGHSVRPPPLTLANVRKYWFILEALYTPLGNLTPTSAQASWVSRIAAIRAHYRQTYQINQAWMQNIRDLRPTRVGILDPVSGARTKSQAWSQYCVEPTAKAFTLAKLQNDPDLQFYWINVNEYPGINGELHGKSPSPATVDVLDKDIGVLKIDYREDPHGMQSQIHPSRMIDDNGSPAVPIRDLREQLQSVIATDGYVTGAAPIGLADDFRAAIVVTAMPFSPNDETRFLKYTVTPESIQSNLKQHYGVTGGQGRPWHIFVPPTLLTAWYALQQTVPGRISAKQMFGFDGVGDGGVQPEQSEFLDELLKESGLEGGGFVEEGGGLNPNVFAGYYVLNFEDLIPAMAKAVAVAQWAAFVNQREGARGVHLQPGIKMAGSMESVRHSLAPDGRLITTISMPTHRRPVPPLAFLPSFARPDILGQIPGIPG